MTGTSLVPLLDGLRLRPDVIGAEAHGDLPGNLLPAEEAVVAAAGGDRRREFTTVRVLARSGLTRLGHPGAPLVPGRGGAPAWPVGVVGSITHCPGYRAVLLARSDEVVSLGVDAEPDQPLPDGVLGVVTTPRERERAADGVGVRCWDRLLFSAKESAYKAWYPLDGRFLTHEDVEVELRPDGTSTARRVPRVLGHDGPDDGALQGRWVRGRGLLLTGVVVPGDGLSPRP